MPDVDWVLVMSHLVSLGVAYGLALPIGWDRETAVRSAGLRTFPLVAVGACAFMLTGLSVLEGADAHARIMYGIIVGIGFIGGGSILKGKSHVTGTATAASVWNTGAIGVAVAWGRIEIALLLAAFNFLTLRYMKRFKESE